MRLGSYSPASPGCCTATARSLVRGALALKVPLRRSPAGWRGAARATTGGRVRRPGSSATSCLRGPRVPIIVRLAVERFLVSSCHLGARRLLAGTADPQRRRALARSQVGLRSTPSLDSTMTPAGGAAAGTTTRGTRPPGAAVCFQDLKPGASNDASRKLLGRSSINAASKDECGRRP